MLPNRKVMLYKNMSICESEFPQETDMQTENLLLGKPRFPCFYLFRQLTGLQERQRNPVRIRTSAGSKYIWAKSFFKPNNCTEKKSDSTCKDSQEPVFDQLQTSNWLSNRLVPDAKLKTRCITLLPWVGTAVLGLQSSNLFSVRRFAVLK